MTTLLFVHGTGVRQEGFDATIAAIKGEVAAELPLVRVSSCFWGKPFGARLHHGGRSIPDYDTARGPGDPDERESTAALWAQLYEDPWFELRLLVSMNVEADPTPGGALTPGEELYRLFGGIAANPPTGQLPTTAWKTATVDTIAALAGDLEFEQLVKAVPTRDTDSEAALARSMAASVMVEGMERRLPALDGSRRDAFVLELSVAFGSAQRAGVLSRLTDPLKGLATRWARKRRGRLSDAILEEPSDILLYQARGAPIRAAIADAVRAVRGDVVIFAHSLGGIMAVDLLVTEHLADVKGLVTVGSQSPLLYEIGALVSLGPSGRLPDHFPRWLNIYDRSDFLSYLAAPTFDDARIRDIEVASDQPFPQAHSAYFTNPDVWKAVASFVSSLK